MKSKEPSIIELIECAAALSKNADAFVPLASSMPEYFFTAKSRTTIFSSPATAHGHSKIQFKGQPFTVSTPMTVFVLENKFNRKPFVSAGRN